MTRIPSLSLSLLLPGLALLLTNAISAQQAPNPANTGAITGVVADHQGTPLVGATVTITSDQSNESTTVLTGVEGSFKLERLTEGNYHVAISAKGFVTETKKAHVKPRHRVTLHVRLKPPSPPEGTPPKSS
jgi:hypothetical protein